jgi:hypothetical protein
LFKDSAEHALTVRDEMRKRERKTDSVEEKYTKRMENIQIETHMKKK